VIYTRAVDNMTVFDQADVHTFSPFRTVIPSTADRCITVLWEGNSAVEEQTEDELAVKQRQKTIITSHRRRSSTRTSSPDLDFKKELHNESADEEASEDDYVEPGTGQVKVRFYNFSSYLQYSHLVAAPRCECSRLRVRI